MLTFYAYLELRRNGARPYNSNDNFLGTSQITTQEESGARFSSNSPLIPHPVPTCKLSERLVALHVASLTLQSLSLTVSNVYFSLLSSSLGNFVSLIFCSWGFFFLFLLTPNVFTLTHMPCDLLINSINNGRLCDFRGECCTSQILARSCTCPR